MEEQPGSFGEEGTGARSQPVVHDIAANRAGPPRPRPRRHQRGAGPVVVVDHLVDGGWGAFCPAWSTIERWEPTSHTGAGSQGTAGGRARTSRPTPAPACRRPPGSSRIPQRPLTAGDGVAPTDDLNRSANRTAALTPITLSAERRRRRGSPSLSRGSPSPPEPSPTRSSRRRRSPQRL